MVEYNLQPPIDISILEILLIIVCSFIGAFVHELLLFIGKGKRITIMVWINVIITVIVDGLICYAINPFITQVLHPRFMVIPPLLLGLMGTELVNKLTTVTGSLNLLEYVLGWFKITKSDKTPTPKSPGDEDKPERDEKSENGSDKDEKSDSKNKKQEPTGIYDLNQIVMIADKAKEIDKVCEKLDEIFSRYASNRDNDELLNGYSDVKHMASVVSDYSSSKLATSDPILQKKMDDMNHKIYLIDKLMQSIIFYSVVPEEDLDPKVMNNIRELDSEFVIILRVPEEEKGDK